jgi:anaphase-promoting complex subunit 2
VSGYIEYIPEEMRRNQHLITDDVMKYMAEYDVRRFVSILRQALQLSQGSGDPDVIGRLVLRLADWYFAWAPGGE